MEAEHNKTDGLDVREQLRIEFYATYDVMTGIRIAATLGGFFGLMVFLVIYKSRSKSVKALKDPKIVEIAAAAVAEEEAEEEERQLAYALEEALGARCSLAGPGPSWPLPLPRPGPRFSSVGGGYSSLLAPPRRLSKMRGDSLPASALRFDYRPPFYQDDIEMTEAADDSMCPEYVNQFLAVPGGSRRFSSITCSSSGSSYLERRGSSIVCALPTIPPAPSHLSAPRNRPTRRYTLHDTESRDVFNPINIQVIQATPELSPCVSEHTILDCEGPAKKRINSAVSGIGEARGIAPLASLGSCGVSLSVDYKDYDLHSVGSDSVFFDEDDCLDTDDEIEQFSTDSDDSVSLNSRGYHAEIKDSRPRRRSRHIVGKSVPIAASPPLTMSSTLLHSSGSPVIKKHRSFLSKPLTRRTLRRLSHPTVIGRQGCSTISGVVSGGDRRTEERRVQDVELGCRPALPTLHSASSADFSGRSPEPLNPQHCSWSQETLF